MIKTEEILDLQAKMIERWHRQPLDNIYTGFLGDVCTQHSFNFLLWHEEDKARSSDANDSEIAAVKRAIDRYNQKRNDWIEKIDDRITEMLVASKTQTSQDARLNSETPASVIDRLSILALRIYHLHEQTARKEIDETHLNKVQHRISVCRSQLKDLSTSLDELLQDIFSGKKRHSTYRQLKMYNDPTFNSYLCQAR